MAIKMNLRKAAAVQTILQEVLNVISIKSNIEINEFQDPATQISEANAKLFADDTRRNDLLMSIYSIRSLVGTQNAVAGISARLSHIAYIDRRINQLNAIVTDATPMQEVSVIQGKLDKIKNQPAETGRHLYRHDEVSTGVLTAEQLENIRAVVRDLRKQKATLNDEILEMNIKTEIEITPDVEAVLVREGIV